MGLISKAALLATGYVLGARAGTARYQQILQAAQTLAARPELQPYLGELARRLPQTSSTFSPASSASGSTPAGTGTPTAAAETLPSPASSPPEAAPPSVTGTNSKGTRLRRRATS